VPPGRRRCPARPALRAPRAQAQRLGLPPARAAPLALLPAAGRDRRRRRPRACRPLARLGARGLHQPLSQSAVALARERGSPTSSSGPWWGP